MWVIVYSSLPLTLFLSDFAAVNEGSLLAGMSSSSPVRGFLPFLAARALAWNVPNPTNVIFLSKIICYSMVQPGNVWSTSSRVSKKTVSTKKTRAHAYNECSLANTETYLCERIQDGLKSILRFCSGKAGLFGDTGNEF